MDQPGPGDRPIGQTLIVDESRGRGRASRALDRILSLGMWALYIYMIRQAFFDAAILVEYAWAWAVSDGARPAIPAMTDFVRTANDYARVIVANGAALIAWALYNQIRFQGRDRGASHEPVHPADLAALYAVPEDDIRRWQAARIVDMSHDADGSLAAVAVRSVDASART